MCLIEEKRIFSLTPWKRQFPPPIQFNINKQTKPSTYSMFVFSKQGVFLLNCHYTYIRQRSIVKDMVYRMAKKLKDGRFLFMSHTNITVTEYRVATKKLQYSSNYYNKTETLFNITDKTRFIFVRFDQTTIRDLQITIMSVTTFFMFAFPHFEN